MASPTKKTSHKRRRREHNKGKERKRQNENKGTTKSAEELFADA